MNGIANDAEVHDWLKEYNTVEEMTRPPPIMKRDPGTTPKSRADASVDTAGKRSSVSPCQLSGEQAGPDVQTMATLVANPLLTLSASLTTCWCERF